MKMSAYINNKALVLILGNFLYLLYGIVIAYAVVLNDVEMSILFAPVILIPIVVFFIFYHPKLKTKGWDDWAMLTSFTLTSCAVFFSLVAKTFDPVNAFFVILLLLANTEVTFFRSNQVACLQIIFSTAFAMFYFLLQPDTVSMKYSVSVILFLVGTWKVVNALFFRDYIKAYDEELKNHTYRSTLATISHELNNTSMVILNYTDRFKKDQNPEVFDKIEGSLERMMKQIDNLESVDRVSFENYLSSQSQIIKLKED